MKQYQDLVRKVLIHGEERGDRTGVGTISLFGTQTRYDLQKGFPLLTTKYVNFKAVVAELLWFLSGSTNINDLDSKIWDPWCNDDGDLGPIYGTQWRSWESWKRVPRRVIDQSTLPPTTPVNSVNLPRIDLAQNTSNLVGKTLVNTTGREMVVYSEYRTPRKDGQIGAVKLRIYFPATGYKTDNVSPQTAHSGLVKDRFTPSAVGVGSLGYPVSDSDREMLYQTWIGILKRCYDSNHVGYQNYGAQGVFVHPDWLVFENFVAGVKRIPKWLEKCEDPDEYSIDKDYYSSNCYSAETCVWASKKEQSVNTSVTGTFQISNIDGTTEVVVGLRPLAIHMDVPRHVIQSAIRRSVPLPDGRIIKQLNRLNDSDAPFRYQNHDQIKLIISQIKHTPGSRRIILNAWNVADIDKMALPPCHMTAQFYVRQGKYLDCQLYQRSADLALGVPFNIASYALLMELMSRECDLLAGELVHTIGDAHVYLNHVEAIQEQLERKPTTLPILAVVACSPDFNKVLDIRASDILLGGYNPQPKIKFEVAV